jgi:hypothetical protein
VFESLRRVDEGNFLYTLASSKTNLNGKVRPEDMKPVVGSAAEALEAWLKASGTRRGPSSAGSSRMGSWALTGSRGRQLGTS